jgi:hypothetical protein
MTFFMLTLLDLLQYSNFFAAYSSAFPHCLFWPRKLPVEFYFGLRTYGIGSPNLPPEHRGWRRAGCVVNFFDPCFNPVGRGLHFFGSCSVHSEQLTQPTGVVIFTFGMVLRHFPTPLHLDRICRNYTLKLNPASDCHISGQRVIQASGWQHVGDNELAGHRESSVAESRKALRHIKHLTVERPRFAQ